jgi:hypothetical protein
MIIARDVAKDIKPQRTRAGIVKLKINVNSQKTKVSPLKMARVIPKFR